MKVDQRSMKRGDSISMLLRNILFHWRRLLLVTVVGVGLACVLVCPFPFDSRSWSQLFNLAHAPSFFTVFLLIAGLIDPSSIGLPAAWYRVLTLGGKRLLVLVVTLTIVGVSCEILQGFVGRTPSISDVLANGSGLAAGFFWCLSRQITSGSRRVALTLTAAGLLIVPSWSPVAELYDCSLQQRAFPVLASFERSRELHTWAPHEATIHRTSEWSTQGAVSMRVEGRAGTVFPGANFQWPIMDWEGFAAVELDLLNPGDTPLTLEINISDATHAASGYAPADRFHTSIELLPGEPEHVRILLTDVRDAPETRRMDLSRMNSLNLSAVQPTSDIAFLVDHVRLTNHGAQESVQLWEDEALRR